MYIPLKLFGWILNQIVNTLHGFLLVFQNDFLKKQLTGIKSKDKSGKFTGKTNLYFMNTLADKKNTVYLQFYTQIVHLFLL